MSETIDYRIASSGFIAGDIGRKIEALRLSRNIRQGDLAEQAGVALRTIMRLEKGENTTLDTLIRVMGALGLTSHLEALFPEPVIASVDQAATQRQRARPKCEQ